MRQLSLGSLVRPYRGRLVAGVACLGLLGAASALYAYLTGPLLALLLSGGQRGREYFALVLPSETVNSTVSASTVLIAVAVLLVVIALVKGLAHLVAAALLDGTAERLGHQLRARVYNHLLHLPFGARRQAVGELMARLLDDVRRVKETTIGAMVSLLREGISAVALAIVAVWIAPQLALLSLVALPLAGIGVAVISRRVQRAARRGQDEVGALAARAHQGLAALREVKSAGAEQRELERFAGHSSQAAHWAMRRIVARACSPLVNEVMAAVGIGVTLLYAGGLVASSAIAAERVVSFFAAILLLYRPLKGIGLTVQQVASGRPSRERLVDLLRQQTEDDAAEPLLPLRRELVGENLSYSYAPSSENPERAAIAGVSVRLRLGRITAVTGPSGAGKSTLANIICGLLRPDSGQLQWDELLLSERSLQALRARVALVPQTPLLLDDTLRDNLRYAAPRASDEQLWDALRAVRLERWARQLADGLDTLIGTAGRQLSVGEAQRVAVARALLREASVMVLDEPSSALDQQNAEAIAEVLRSAARDHAILVVAHTKTLLDVADEVVELRDGRRLSVPGNARSDNVLHADAMS